MEKNNKSQFFVANYRVFKYIKMMSQRNLSKEVMYEGVKTLLEADVNHIHLGQQKLYTLYSLAFNYFLYLSGSQSGHYIIRVEDSQLLEKLMKKAKDDSSRKFLQKLALPRKFKYGNSTFHIDFFSFTTWAATNEIPKEKIKGALIVKNARKSPVAHDFSDDETYQQTLQALPKDYYYTSLQSISPKTVVIAFDEEFENTTEIKFPFIKEEESSKLTKGVSIASDINVEDLDS